MNTTGTMNGKDILDKLKAYFMKQDIETVCTLCAIFALDTLVFHNYDSVSEEHKNILAYRFRNNVSVIASILSEDPECDSKIYIMTQREFDKEVQS